jgi:hypothetical protein
MRRSARSGRGLLPPRRRVRRSEEVALIPAIHGRPVISRADMAARGVPRTTVDGWYRDRARTGYPEKAGRVGRTDYWYEDEWTAWHERHLRGKIRSLTDVDRGGNPDDLVDAAEAARMLRYSSRYVIHANRRLGYFPELGVLDAPNINGAGINPGVCRRTSRQRRLQGCASDEDFRRG